MSKTAREVIDSLDPKALGDEFIRRLDAAGFVIVPKEPTDEMLTASEDSDDRGKYAMQHWSAMIAAAKAPP